MSDAPAPDGAPRTPDEMDTPGNADEAEFSGDEVTEATPPNAEEGDEAPEAD